MNPSAPVTATTVARIVLLALHASGRSRVRRWRHSSQVPSAAPSPDRAAPSDDPERAAPSCPILRPFPRRSASRRGRRAGYPGHAGTDGQGRIARRKEGAVFITGRSTVTGTGLRIAADRLLPPVPDAHEWARFAVAASIRIGTPDDPDVADGQVAHATSTFPPAFAAPDG